MSAALLGEIDRLSHERDTAERQLIRVRTGIDEVLRELARRPEAEGREPVR